MPGTHVVVVVFLRIDPEFLSDKIRHAFLGRHRAGGFNRATELAECEKDRLGDLELAFVEELLTPSQQAQREHEQRADESG
jgi:hypothetical protein